MYRSPEKPEAYSSASYGYTGACKNAVDGKELKQIIRKLPQELRLPLVLYYFDSRDVKTVAKTMNISVSSAYSRIRTATKRMYQIFIEE
jgi:DNA-directed RNA polymerase specialized sigma24 family protein